MNDAEPEPAPRKMNRKERRTADAIRRRILRFLRRARRIEKAERAREKARIERMLERASEHSGGGADGCEPGTVESSDPR